MKSNEEDIAKAFQFGMAFGFGKRYDEMDKIIDEIKKVITPQPKTGHWIDDEFGSKCSCCGIHTHLDKFDRPMKFKYCSMCGAKMQEVEENGQISNI